MRREGLEFTLGGREAEEGVLRDQGGGVARRRRGNRVFSGSLRSVNVIS